MDAPLFSRSTVAAEISHDFNEFWRLRFPDCPPLGYELRLAYEDRWLRLHSLPQSKRLPDTAVERTEILRRQRAIADDVLGVGSRCFMVGYEYSGAQRLPPSDPVAAFMPPHASPSLSIPAEDPESPTTAVFATVVTWQHAVFDRLLLGIARDETRALWIAIESGGVFAPYDGGVDIIFPNEWERDAARSNYQSWLSHRPDGL